MPVAQESRIQPGLKAVVLLIGSVDYTFSDASCNRRSYSGISREAIEQARPMLQVPTAMRRKPRGGLSR